MPRKTTKRAAAAERSQHLAAYRLPRLADEPTVAVTTKIPASLLERLDVQRDGEARSSYIRRLIEQAVAA